MISESFVFDDHLCFYNKLFGTTGNASDYTIRKAWGTHALIVFNPLRDLNLDSIKASNKLLSKEAQNFLKYGAGRRLLAIWYSYRSIINIANPERTKPLTEHEAHEINKDINLIYMHLRGVLDNYAWTYIYEKEPKLLKQKKGKDRNNIGLFNPEIIKNSTNRNFWAKLEIYNKWAKELSNKRDPVAHRVPLYVVPSIITPNEYEEYNDLENKKNEALLKLDFNKITELSVNQRQLGTFPMVFAHNPIDKPIPIYPTIPTDMANLIQIQKIILDELSLI